MKTLFWLALTAATALAEPTPQGPAVSLSRDRAEIVLNGVWRFQPADSSNIFQPHPAEWGEFPVPGTWVGDWRIRLPRDPVSKGAGEVWEKTGAAMTAGWYERSFTVPRDWANRKTLLQVGRVSTDALVWIDGNPVGMLGHTGGELDLTKLIHPGKESLLRIFVAASKSELKEFSFANLQIPLTDGGCASKGITGDVALINRPAGPRIDHVAVLPSVRKSELTLHVELADAADLSGKMLDLSADAFDAQSSKPVKHFSAKVSADSAGVIRVSFPWQGAHLWDTDDPFLHSLTLTLQGAGIDDQFRVPHFGFREFWAEGRDLFLNGSLIRLRPGEASAASNQAAIRADLRRRLAQGHNILEIWPQDSRERGFTESWAHYAAEASKAGMLIMMPTVKLNNFFNRGDEAFRQWTELARRDWRDHVNEPSVVIMIPSGNMQWLAADLDPRWLGRSDVPPMNDYQARDWAKLEQANAALKEIDPTRLIMHHQGGPKSEVAASNTYLLWAPLQEREEWPKSWADRTRDGVLPFCAIEFGTPLDCSFFRNRHGFSNAYSGEALLTEFAAIYLGPAAYEMETAAYRKELLAGNFMTAEPPRWPPRQNPPAMVTAPAFQEIQRLFQRNTMRSWRTWGLSGGMVPWNEGFTHRTKSYDEGPGIQAPGDRGSHYPRIRKSEMADSFHDPVFETLPTAQVFDSHHQATLAWIAGKPSDWTEKSHHFRAGTTLEKSIALINDSRRAQPYEARWELKRDGETADTGELKGLLAVGEIKLAPLSLTTPGVARKTDFTLHLTATIGGVKHEDQFALRIWPMISTTTVASTLFDPVGKTSAMLGQKSSGPNSAPGKLTIIGREALSSGGFAHDRLTALESHVAAGNTLLIMAQHPEWMKRWWGFRTCRQVARRAWPVNRSHPLWRDIDARDLRDWSGAGTLLESHPAGKPTLPPLFMHRWGNQGSISSAAIEKPHLSAWTPLLQCEFDLQYSPLLELRRGNGRVILCLLDLEDQAPRDPAAAAALTNILQYAAAPIPPRMEIDGIAPNDLPPRIATEVSLAKTHEVIHSTFSDTGQVPFKDRIAPLQTIHRDADAKPWLRFPRWRLTRVEHQLRANAGEQFPADARIFNPRCDNLDLSGPWMFRPISKLNAPANQPLPDPGLSQQQRDLCMADFNESMFVRLWMPESFLDDTDGDAVLNRDITLPAHWLGKRLKLDLGTLQSSAILFYNGTPISGKTPIAAGQPLAVVVPPELVTRERATIALRLWNNHGPGGYANAAATKLCIEIDGASQALPLYHPDYRADFKDGDEPYRWFRW